MYFSRDALYQFIVEKSKNKVMAAGILSASVCIVTGIYLGIGAYFSSTLFSVHRLMESNAVK